ncbi:MAG: hypothetical protein Q4D16_08340 [Eubacteriales bacterium]|nr:hypothetical protein [Eubacteriales bacterium]
MDKFQQFYEKLTESGKEKEFQEILLKYHPNAASFADIGEEAWKEVGKMAEDMGYSIKPEEAVEYFSGEEIELDEDDLDSVAGGKGKNYVYDGEGAQSIEIEIGSLKGKRKITIGGYLHER